MPIIFALDGETFPTARNSASGHTSPLRGRVRNNHRRRRRYNLASASLLLLSSSFSSFYPDNSLPLLATFPPSFFPRSNYFVASFLFLAPRLFSPRYPAILIAFVYTRCVRFTIELAGSRSFCPAARSQAPKDIAALQRPRHLVHPSPNSRYNKRERERERMPYRLE